MRKSPTALLLLFSLLAIDPAQAAGTQQAQTKKLDYDTVCSDVLKLETEMQKAGDSVNAEATQKLEYCRAAADSRKASKNNSTLSKVWGGVAGVCVTACVMALIPGGGTTMQTVCSGASIAGGATDMVVTKNYMNGLMSVATGAAGIVLKGKEGASKLTACANAATSTLQTLTKMKASKSASETMQQNLGQANDIGPVTNAYGPLKAQTVANAPSINITQNNGIRGGTGVLGNDVSAKPVKLPATDCGQVGNATGQAAVGCAIASDPNLPGFVGSPEFDAELAKVTGMGLNDFVSKVDDPAAAIGSAAEANLPDGLGTQVAALVGQTANDIGSTYTSGGGAPVRAAARGGDDDGAALASVAAKFMQKLQGGAGAEEGGVSDGSKVAFESQEKLPGHLRGPASEDDASVSLFDRVTYRYYFVGKRIVNQ